MTDEQCDAGIGRLVKEYAEVKKRIVVLERTQAHVREALQKAATALMTEKGPNNPERFEYMDHTELNALLDDLCAMKEEKTQIEQALTHAGLGNLVK